jgi:cytochrome bd-type quinol oxidase subunit 2
MAPDLLAKIGGTDLLALISSIILTGHITDVSPLSTLGAIFIANATEDQDKKKLFRNLMIWGLAMSPVGAIVCWLMFTVLGIP